MKKCLTILVAAMCLVAFSKVSFAAVTTQVDSLVDALVKKGVLTEDEGSQLKGQISSDAKNLHEEDVKKDLPQWVQDMKLKGDFRVRHEWSHRNNAADLDRNRGRLRWRLGVDTKVNEKVTVAVGIASNGGDGTNSAGTATTSGTNFSPRSNNESFQNTFSKQAIVLNYAYAQYKPNDKLTLTGGKMINPIWEPWEFLWDSDITPEGGAVQVEYPLSSDMKLIGTLTAFQIDEISGNEADPFMYVAQAGVKGNLTEKMDYKIMGNYHGTDNITKTLLANRSGTNTLNPANTSQYAYHYNTIGGGLELGLNDPFGEEFPFYVPRVGMFGEYMYNPDPPNKNTAYMMGAYLGNSAVNGWKTWKAIGAYKVIGQDAFLDTFPDSDFYSGSTDVKGYEAALEIGLAKNVSFSLDYYRTERIKTTKAQESLLQTDMNFKF